ncbi:putative copper chaperone CopZ [Gemella bergeri ATCC 700627]|uniref:Putative copper chaperone CopZ n=1 Tax=Gemella bergeri ATCC 700627 TaxID=1321820 RepID=U2RVT8_9BACL|nr:heavy metal-associated domain-containing protein [Gemella bergeri]ERK57683.1 putative copper chaperone CopZ [Gemella bergeri ATCC 700627]
MKRFKIGGMGCTHCVRIIEETVSALDNVKSASVDFENKVLTVEYVEGEKVDEIIKAVEEIGYELTEI